MTESSGVLGVPLGVPVAQAAVPQVMGQVPAVTAQVRAVDAQVHSFNTTGKWKYHLFDR